MSKAQISSVDAQSDAAALEARIISKGLEIVYRNYPV